MKFTKYNNPNRRRRKRSPYSQEYIAEQRDRMYELLAKAKTEAEKDNIIKAFHITINP